MGTKTIALDVETYISLKSAMLKEFKKTKKSQFIGKFIQGLLDEHNRI